MKTYSQILNEGMKALQKQGEFAYSLSDQACFYSSTETNSRCFVGLLLPREAADELENGEVLGLCDNSQRLICNELGYEFYPDCDNVGRLGILSFLNAIQTQHDLTAGDYMASLGTLNEYSFENAINKLALKLKTVARSFNVDESELEF